MWRNGSYTLILLLSTPVKFGKNSSSPNVIRKQILKPRQKNTNKKKHGKEDQDFQSYWKTTESRHFLSPDNFLTTSLLRGFKLIEINEPQLEIPGSQAHYYFQLPRIPGYPITRVDKWIITITKPTANHQKFQVSEALNLIRVFCG